MVKRILCFSLAVIMIFPASYYGGIRTTLSTSPAPILRLVQSSGIGVTLDLIIPDYRPVATVLTSGFYHRLSLPGFQFTSEAGKPQMPVISTLVGVPPDAKLELRLLADDAQTVHGSFEVPPAPYPIMLQGDTQDESKSAAQGSGWDYRTDPVVYSADASFPLSPVNLSPDAWVRDQRVVRVDFYPFQYNPRRGSLTWHRNIRVQILFNSEEISIEQPYIQESALGLPDPFAAILKSSLINYDTARFWRRLAPAASLEQPVSDIPQAPSTRYKITVDHDGLYRLTYTDLVNAGVDLAHANPFNFSLSSQIEPVAISLSGAMDGKFDPGDTLTFYGQKFHGDRLAARYASEADNWITYTTQLTNGQRVPWHPTIQPITMEKFTDNNVYWLEINGSGPRIGTINGDPSGSLAAIPQYFAQTVRTESPNVRFERSLTSQEEWFWELVQDTKVHSYTTNLTALSSPPFSVTIRADIVANNNLDGFTPDHHVQFFINSDPTPLADAKWDGISRYHLDAEVSQSSLAEGVNLLKLVPLHDGGSSQPVPSYYMSDWIDITYARQFQALNNTLSFTGDISGTWKYQIGGFTTPDISVFDITQPMTPTQIISASVSGNDPYTLTFIANHPAGEKFIAASSAGFQSPKSIQTYQDHLASITQGADYVMITASELITATQALANYRQSQGLHTLVIDINDIYNEFNDGIYHPFAIKQFLKYAYATWQIKPVYAVLVGDGNWNVKGYAPAKYGNDPIFLPPNLSWVDPWLDEVDSANLLANIVGNDPVPDIFISRMPVRSQAELYAILDKISSYENAPIQSWQHNMLFVADNADDAGDFSASLDDLIVSSLTPGFNPSRIYLDNYFNSDQCFLLQPCPQATHDITETLSISGALFLTYSGHGSKWLWGVEKLLSYNRNSSQIVTKNDIASMNNGSMLPVVLSLDCQDGDWIHPINQPSLAELFLTTPNRGAVSTFSPTGWGLAYGHDILAEGFYTSFFKDGNWQLGPASLSAKLALFASGDNYDEIETYTVFGDPALKVHSPYNPALSPSQASQMGPTGMNVSYELSIQNLSIITDTFTITGSGSAWNVEFPTLVGPLSPGGSQVITATVQIPQEAILGTKDTLHLSLLSKGDTGKVVTSTLETTVGLQRYLPILAR
jgi:hypothetical protein